MSVASRCGACISSGVSNSVSGRAEAPERPESRGWLLVLAARLAECGLVLLFCWFGSPAGSPVDGWFGVPDRAVWSPPGGYPTGCHGQSAAAFVDEVVMLLTQREQVVDRCFAAVTEELNVIHLAVINDRPASERLVSDTKRSLVTVVRHRRSRQVAH